MILVALLCASFVSFTWIILMRFLTGVMVWTSIFLLIVGSGGGLGYSVYRYLTLLRTSINTKDTQDKTIFNLSNEELFILKGIFN